MAYITVNETGTFPAIILSTDVANCNVGANGNGFLSGNSATLLNVTCLQDVTLKVPIIASANNTFFIILLFKLIFKFVK